MIHSATPWIKDGTDICERTSDCTIHVIAQLKRWENFDKHDFRNRGTGAYVKLSVPICGNKDYREVMDANAAFIVRAVNSHDDLVVALETILLSAKQVGHRYAEVVAAKALTKAKGEA